jgi:glycosyltransferase involved in cell wall biosynthesis
MRIGIEAQRIFRKKKHGMEMVALELIRELQEIDTVNEYILFAKKGEDNSAVRAGKNLRIETIASAGYAHWEQVKLPKAAKKAGVDLLHCTANTAPLQCTVPLIITLHDIIYLEEINFGGSLYQDAGNLYRRFVVPKLVKNARRIITVSQYEKKQILKRFDFLPDDGVQVIYNAVSSRFHSQHSVDEIKNVNQLYRLPSNFILFFGNTAPKKNSDNVIRAYVEYHKLSKEVLPIVITDYDKLQVMKLLTSINASHLIDHFIFPGYIPNDDMPPVLQAASLFLYPSLRESFGLPILEAMACGTPVITSNTSAMPEIAGNAAMHIDPYQPLQIAQAIENMISNDALRNEYITKGFERAAQFSWRKSAEQLLKLYNEEFQRVYILSSSYHS